MTRCDGCGHCVDICPSDIMHIDETIRRAKNIEPNFCWECFSCVKACPNHAIDVRGYADFAPMGHSVRVRREEEKGTRSWKIKFRNGTVKDFVSPTVIPITAVSNPLITCRSPTLKNKGLPLVLELSNSVPSSKVPM